MTKPEPVCGALTHKKTPCQNTLVTGCGLCPVHASQLRASNAGFKQRSKARRKKPSIALLQTEQLTPTTLVPCPIQLNDPPISHTPIANTRPIRPITHPHPAILQDQFFYNITPIHPSQNDFYHDQSIIHTLKNGPEVLDILKTESLSMISPVTPKAPDAAFKGDLFAEDQQVREHVVVSNHCPGEHELHGSPDPYLLEVDLSMDLPVPKFD